MNAPVRLARGVASPGPGLSAAGPAPGVLLALVAAAIGVPVIACVAYGYATGSGTAEFGLPGHPLLTAAWVSAPGLAATLFAERRLRSWTGAPAGAQPPAKAPPAALLPAAPLPVAPPPPVAAPAHAAPPRRDVAASGPMPGFAASKGMASVATGTVPGGGAKQAGDRHALNDRSLHSQRMEALGTLASGIVHDFGNVLQVMEGAVSEILEEAADQGAVERSARLLQDVIQGSRGGVRRLLSFARDDRLQTTDCDVLATLTGVAEVLQRALPKRVAIRCDIPADLPRMRVDPGRLEAMLLNVATNAQHAMPDGGVLGISARLHRITEAGVPASGLRLGRYVRIEVADNGTGMSAATLARAAEPFFTTKEAGQGTGLGLYSTRSFAEQSGGAFAIASTLGHGTTVTLWLPCVAEPQASGAVSPPRNQAPRVLLLDDEPTIRDVLARQLRKRGLQVDVCENAAEALAATTGPQQVDLLLTDFAMPDLSCDTLIARVHVARPGLPVIVLTGYPLDANALVEAYAGTGLLTLMCKPISAREIEETIRQMLDVAGPAQPSGPV